MSAQADRDALRERVVPLHQEGSVVVGTVDDGARWFSAREDMMELELHDSETKALTRAWRLAAADHDRVREAHGRMRAAVRVLAGGGWTG